MPPINQQGSRAALVTALVVFVILFVISSVFAFQFYGRYKDKDLSFTDLQKKYNDYVLLPGPTPTGPLGDLLAAKTDAVGKLDISQSDTVMDVAIKEIAALQKTITSSNTVKPVKVVEEANKALKDAQDVLTKGGVTSVTVPTTGLQAAVAALSKAVVAKQAEYNKSVADLRDANAQLATAKADITKQAADHDDELKKQQAASDAALATAQQAATKNDAAMAQMQADEKAAADKALADQTQASNDLNNANQQVTKLTAQVRAAQDRLAGRRADVINPIVRQVDAKIVRVPNNEVCYINLGYGDQVTPGLTFEVYDKAEGVPAIPDNASGDEQLPVGKASIEITHVGTTSSECRIVKISPGAVISEGDVIENLVYDPHVKYNFYVFGKFDLANNGRPNDPDADVIKRLITQWGGKLTDKVNVDTDFVVLGSEPVLPNFSKDELTAENQDKLDKAIAAQNQYNDIKAQAQELHIPIMNQNRFLYYVGFYDQAKR